MEHLTDVVAAAKAWRSHRHPKRAALVDQLVASEAPFRIAGATKEAFQESWIEAAKLDPDDPVRTVALARALARKIPVGVDSSTDERLRSYFARVAALAERPHVPGVAWAIVELLEQAPFSSYDVAEIYAPVIELLVAIGDVRVVDRLNALLDRPRARLAVTRAYFADALPRAVTALADVAPLSESEEIALDSVLETEPGIVMHVVTRSAGELDALLDDCLARPEDDAARMVYADALLERGDPRGAFIQLQLASPDDVKAHASLLRRHERKWLGEAARVTKLRVWRRGFLDEAELVHRAAADPGTWARSTTSPALASVRTLHRGKANEKLYSTFVTSPVLSQLRTIEVASMPFLVSLERRGLEQIDFRMRAHRRTFERIDEHLDRLGITRISLESEVGPTETRDVVAAWSGRRRLVELAIEAGVWAWEPWRSDPTPWLFGWDLLEIPRLGIGAYANRLVVQQEPDGTVFVDARLRSETQLVELLATKRLVVTRVRLRGNPSPGYSAAFRRALSKVPQVDLREGWSTG